LIHGYTVTNILSISAEKGGVIRVRDRSPAASIES
jgi:hypothetical protein